MNRKMVFYMLGNIIKLEAVLMAPAVVCSLIYRDNGLIPFLITIAVALILGFTLTLLNKPKDKTIFAREGFVIVALAWVALSAIGALPFVISGEIPSYTDAFFETVSGFTTTGASILKDVEAMSKGLLFWRSFTHWIGGMGVLVLMMAIVPNDSGRTIHIMRAEMPGPIVGKLVPRVKSTAKILYLIYIVMTAIQVILLLCGDMSLFDSLLHTFGTAGTGGFGTKADSVAGYSPYIQWVIVVFMFLFGINFNLYYLLLIRKAKAVFKSEELFVYISIVAVSIVAITIDIYPIYKDLSEAVRASAFQVVTIITTTGFATADFNLWPTLSKGILFLLMFSGACAGSTAGGLKVSRIILLFRHIRSNLKHMLHSRSVDTLRFEGKTVDNATATNVTAYFALYFLCFSAMFIILCIADPFDLETNITAVSACFNNVGPGFGQVGPASNFAEFSTLSKWTLSAGMLFGRLEILPMILLFAPTVWIKNKSFSRK
ncbi:MAG: TrkH family potassium uptake protein [Clostridia bacterium]|nr:TrkH family potassium uptake protein [Clostridia bacterium]